MYNSRLLFGREVSKGGIEVKTFGVGQGGLSDTFLEHVVRMAKDVGS
jgi:hypothetical protein